MSTKRSLVERIRRGDPIPLPLGIFLHSITPATRLGMAFRKRKPVTAVNAMVISYGNITAGGTGKTPAVLERAQAELDRGKRVGILTRGYHAGSGRRAVVSTDVAEEDRFSELGDEAALILRRLPQVTVFKGADRITSARAAVENYHCDVLILDDGFQYVPLHRDENILVVDATNPFGNGRLLPRGILREPLIAMRRATEIILTRCDQTDDLTPILDTIEKYAPHVPVRQTCHAPSGLWQVASGDAWSLEKLRERPVKAACALGNPDAFLATLQGMGVTVSEFHAFPDHARLPDSLLATDELLVVTEKDAVRMTAPGPGVAALAIALAPYSPS
jgi:tetraacyldisaccharide 4'-kinase